jgi:hypothetical protein
MIPGRLTKPRPGGFDMPSEKLPEVWLRGPLPGVSPLLMPAAHCLMQCREEIAIDSAVQVLRSTNDSDLMRPRSVGRAALPSNLLGLLFHCAEHTHRHTGQLVTTATIVRARTPRTDRLS